jgi:DNA-binding response OmpR family regulator
MSQTPNAPKKRILLCEDDTSVLKVTKLRLEYEGYEVIAAHDGEEVLEQAATQLPIHLILLDIRLPKRDGYDVCRTLKQQSATAQIPVIIFTGSESQWEVLGDRCIELGVTDWMKKPFPTMELMAKVHRALGEAIGE